MTIPRRFGQGTPFSNWLRNNEKLSSEKGFTTTDLDYIWICKDGINSAGSYYLIETKNMMAELREEQHNSLTKIARNCLNDPHFKGLVYLQFEKTNPDDGKIFWNSVEITTEQLIAYLAFEKVPPKNVRFAK